MLLLYVRCSEMNSEFLCKFAQNYESNLHTNSDFDS